MLPDRVSNPGPLTYESGALPIVLRGPAQISKVEWVHYRRSSLGHTFPYDLPKKKKKKNGPVPKVQKLYPGQIHPSENRPYLKRGPVLQGGKYEVTKAASFA